MIIIVFSRVARYGLYIWHKTDMNLRIQYFRLTWRIMFINLNVENKTNQYLVVEHIVDLLYFVSWK